MSVLVVARQLGSHTTGYVTWKGGSGSSLETSVVTEYDNSRLQLGLQVHMKTASDGNLSREASFKIKLISVVREVNSAIYQIVFFQLFRKA